MPPAANDQGPCFVHFYPWRTGEKKNCQFSLLISIQTPSRPLVFIVNFYLNLPVLHLQPRNHILKANRATALDPWYVWLQTSQPDRLLDSSYKTAVADPDTFGKLGLAHFVLVIQTGDHCWFFYWKAKKQIKKKESQIRDRCFLNQWHKRLWDAFPALLPCFASYPLMKFVLSEHQASLNRSTVSTLLGKATHKRTQHFWMLHVASVCTPCCMLLRIVGSCCIRLHTTANTEATTPNSVGPTMLGVVTVRLQLAKSVYSNNAFHQTRLCPLLDSRGPHASSAVKINKDISDLAGVKICFWITFLVKSRLARCYSQVNLTSSLASGGSFRG